MPSLFTKIQSFSFFLCFLFRILTFKNKKGNGEQKDYFENGKIEQMYYRKKGKGCGIWTEYYMTGEIAGIKKWKNNGKIKLNKYFDKTGKEVNPSDVFLIKWNDYHIYKDSLR